MSDDTAQLHPALRAAVETLDAHGARWALLRTPESLARPSGDVDLLVHPHDLPAARAALCEVGFAPIAASGPSAPLLAYDETTTTWLHLDLTAHVVPERWARPELTARVLERSRRVGDLARLDPADEAAALIAHLAERPGAIKDRHVADLSRTAAASVEGSPIELALRETGPRVGEAYRAAVTALAQADADGARSAVRRLAEALPRRRGLASIVGSLVRRPVSAWRHRGASVALLGPDGAGKSTLARCVADRSFLPTRIIYMGTGDPGELSARPWALRWLRGPGLFAIGGIATQWARYLDGLASRIRGHLVIFDRYTEEALLPARAEHSAVRRLGRRVRRLLVCPAPELAVVLDAPGDLMFDRKGEHDAEHLERERLRYQALVQELPRVALLDARRPREEICGETMRAAWTAYRDRVVDRRRGEQAAGAVRP